MPLRRLTARDRSSIANWQLAALLASIAGAVDVTGFLALRQYTTHMSGLVALIAAELSLKGLRLLLGPATVLVSFLAGAAVCAVLVNWSRRRGRESLYAVPLLLEALLLATVSLPHAAQRYVVTLCILSFSMGLQNAVITKISHAEIRTTHITGMVTDIGIELGKLLYWNRNLTHARVQTDRARLLLLSMLVALFFAGGAMGAFTYSHIGFLLMLPLSLTLAALTIFPITADFHTSAAD
jgi:uncharacterized membrane protein YoaK (UPF0700 family)